MKFSNRILELKESPIRKMATYVNEAIDRGIKINHLNIGQPDIETPSVFMDEIKKYENKVLKYAPSQGLDILQDAIVKYYRYKNIHLSREHIIITTGASEAILFVVTAICDIGDEILIPEPFYVNTRNFFDQLGVEAIGIPTESQSNFHLPGANVIKNLISNKTRAIMITNPNNPTGTVYTETEMKLIIDIALEYDLFIIADEVYSSITFDKREIKSFAHFNQIENKVIIIDSISKRYSSCGARIGALISKNMLLVKQVIKLAQARLSVATLDQIGASALYKIDEKYYEHISQIYEHRRNIVIHELNQIPHIKYGLPEGAFYLLIELPFIDAEEFVIWMLKDFNLDGETVLVTPAKDFYTNENVGKNQIRIAFVNDDKQLIKSIKILKSAIYEYSLLENGIF